MESINKIIKKTNAKYPEKVLQFGEGNFLRAFSTLMIDKANKEGIFNGSVVLCEPRGTHNVSAKINAQDSIYTVITRGLENGHIKEEVDVVTSVSRCLNPLNDFEELKKIVRTKEMQVIISNTTEAGIVFVETDKITDNPPSSFPAKLTVLLHERFSFFKDSSNLEDSKILILPTELIDYNGDVLKRTVLEYIKLWSLENAFLEWINTYAYFTNTLVDRIVTGYPKDEEGMFQKKLGYKDELMVACEFFSLWVIEGKEEWREIFPIDKVIKTVLWKDVLPYKKRKVKILNGGHTSTVLAACLYGYEYVLDFITDDVFNKYLKKVLFEEIMPTLDLEYNELETFALAVIDRFSNPYIKHRLLDISLNSASKVQARLMPSIADYYKIKKEYPRLLAFSIASFILFYKGEMIDGKYMGKNYKGITYEIRDSKEVIDFFCSAWKNNDIESIVEKTFKDILKTENIFALDKLVINYIKDIEQCKDIKHVMKNIII